MDDDRSTALTIEAILRRAGFHTDWAGDAATALRELPAARPDLILLDVTLPDGSGFDLCRTFQTIPALSQVPVVFISSHEGVSSKVRGFEAGGVDYLTKPVSGAEVVARVRTHLRLRVVFQRLEELQAERVQHLASAQKQLMPRPADLPEARFQVSLRQILAAGGDFYDVIPVGGEIVDYLVADASGHDLAASLWTASLKALVAEYAGPVHLPIEVVSAINGALCRILPSGTFFTLVYARLNRQSGRLAIVSAGHPPAILVPAGAGEAVVVREEGDVIGVFPDALFGTAEYTLQPGDRLFLYSDGLVETGGPLNERIRRLAAQCAARRDLPLDRLVTEVVDEMTRGVTVTDDLILLGLER